LDYRSRVLVAAACAALILAPLSASAQTDAGRIHYQAGAADYESGDYSHALAEFQRAYELSQRPALFYNISLCYQQLGDAEHTVEYLERYLNEVQTIPNRENLQRRLTNFQERLAAEQDAAAEQAAADQAAADQAAADQAAADQAAADQAATAGGSGTGDGSGGGANVAAIASFAGGGVGLVMAVAFGAKALGDQSDCDSRAGGLNPCTSGDGSSMDTFALLSDIGTGLAVVGVGLGLVFLLTADNDEEADPARASVHLSPFASPNAAGLAAQGRF